MKLLLIPFAVPIKLKQKQTLLVVHIKFPKK